MGEKHNLVLVLIYSAFASAMKNDGSDGMMIFGIKCTSSTCRSDNNIVTKSTSSTSSADVVDNLRDLAAKQEILENISSWPFSSRTDETPMWLSTAAEQDESSDHGDDRCDDWSRDCVQGGGYKKRRPRNWNASKAAATRAENSNLSQQKRSISWVSSAMLSYCTEDPCRCSKCVNGVQRRVRGRQQE